MTGAQLRQDLNSFQQCVETGSSAERTAAKLSQPEDLAEVEIGRLLEDVRGALDGDLDTATRAVRRFAELLASKLSNSPCSAPARCGLAPWQKRKIQSYIGDRLELPLSGKYLAKLVSLSTGYFCHAFKESFGEPPYAYIARLRIERAKELMLTTSQSLSEIALACGYVDQPHLCRRFRRATGTTPGAWRRSHAIEP